MQTRTPIAELIGDRKTVRAEVANAAHEVAMYHADKSSATPEELKRQCIYLFALDDLTEREAELLDRVIATLS